MRPLRASFPWNGLSALVVALGLAAFPACTVQTVTEFPDAGPLPDTGPPADAGQMDAGPTLPPPTIDTCTAAGMGATLGESCASNAACDDGCYCNGVERCEANVCVMGADPCVDEVDCTAEVCLEEANRCFFDPQHGMCSDGDACNGAELCDLVDGCTSGVPLYCNDESSCTIDSCDTEMGCVFVARDLDADGFTDGRCGGEDCDDDPRVGADIYPGAPEDCSNRRDDDCDGQRDFNDDDCLPTNDACASATVLPGPGTYSGSTRSLASDYPLSCRETGPDAVFRFTLTESQDVTVTVAGGGSAGVALRPFAMCADGPDDRCNSGSPPTFLRRSLPAGDYAVIVKTSTSGGVPFDLNLRFDPPTPIPPIDVCDAMTQDLCGGMPCGASVVASFSGLFSDTEDNYRLSCAGSTARPDAAYTFTLDAPKDVTLTASTRDESFGRTAYITVLTDCDEPTSELACRSGTNAQFRQREMPAGTYFVLIESSDSDPRTWNLEVEITDPVPRNTGDACSTAIDISEATLGGGGSGAVDITTLELDSGTSCGGSTGSSKDATFTFTLPETRDVTITTEADGSTHYGQLQTTCADAGSSLRCWSGSGVRTQTWRSLPAGTYFLHVSTTRSSGMIDATIITGLPTPIPPNDRCDGAIVLNNGDSRTDTTVEFEDDLAGGTCATGSRPDAFYTFTLAASRRAIIALADPVTPSTRQYQLTLRTACEADPSNIVTCVAGNTPTVNQVLAAGTYILMVETTAAATADFNISFLTP
ncbi:MAG: hypothetical protein AB8I08_37600 [Sandaracinaceae bacterium]